MKGLQYDLFFFFFFFFQTYTGLKQFLTSTKQTNKSMWVAKNNLSFDGFKRLVSLRVTGVSWILLTRTCSKFCLWAFFWIELTRRSLKKLGNEILNAFELLLITKIRFDNAIRSNYRAVMIFVWKSFQNDPLPNKGIHDDCLQFQSYNTTLIKTIGTLFFMI